MSASLFLLAFQTQPVLAYAHTQGVWSRDDVPIEWFLSDIVDDSFEEADQLPVLEKSWQNWWDAAPCAEMSDSYEGIREGYSNGFDFDGISTFVYEDPGDELESGINGASLCLPLAEQAFSINGVKYYYVYDCDIVGNNDVNWGTTAEIDAGLCEQEMSVEGVMTHEIGHNLGLGHSCEEIEVDEGDCEDPDLQNATMYWSSTACETWKASPEEDDIAGLYALYGPSCVFEATDDSITYGGAPLEVCFDIECNENPSEVRWSFGDGETSTELEVCHTYTEKGQYSVSMTTSSNSEECGDWSYTQIERAYVLVCGQPEPADGFKGLFTYEHFDGLVYQLVNQTDVSVYGCVDQIQWDVFDGNKLIQSVNAWSPKIEFPSEGKYRVVLNVGGPGGISAGELEIEAVDEPGAGGGCATAPAAAGLFGVVVGLGAAVRRRRDD